MSKNQSVLIDFFLKEWLLVVSAVGFVLVAFYSRHFPGYTIREVEVLFILFVLFIAVKGLQNSGYISYLAQVVENGKAIPLKLVVVTFFLSILITNDVALIVIVPLTLSLNINRKDILVILEALAANAGSALTPFGNPQNLYIYWFYNLHAIKFITVIAPFSLILLSILIVASLFVKTEAEEKSENHITEKINNKSALIYGVLLIIVLLSVLHILPIESCFIIIAYVLLFDRKTLKVDYSLLLSFFFFFGLANNMKVLLESDIQHSGHVFIFSALASQFMSNVPVALLFSKFTSNWQALLWGTNTGGFGSLFGSFANLIVYRLYVTHKNINKVAAFSVKFLILGYAAFFISIILYFIA